MLPDRLAGLFTVSFTFQFHQSKVDTMKQLFVIVAVIVIYSSAAAESLKIGLLQIEDSVPFYVAAQEGFFEEENVRVELVPFLSALERDSALTAGAIDGAISDPIGALLLDQGRELLKITSLGLGKTPAEGVFAILAAPSSGIQTVEDLKGVEIAVSNATIIEYVTDRLLEMHGFSPEQIRKVEVKKMPIRMQMLLSDSVQAATLPEPLSSIAAGKGARVLISDADLDQSLSQTVVVISTKAMIDKKEAIRSLFRAYARAVEAINGDPERFRALVVEKGRIPPFMTDSYPIAVYPAPEPFSRELFEPAAQWLAAKGLIEMIAYEDIVATDFLVN
ncbi:MAG: ABC transporter substrate-binding protein [Desulfofustis sp.]|nr:ABC transporter substrate-binding protein [Desulfofustis sp.]NNF46815.1 ABC transporter substrate-binding protein [Desulfofustis sp.]NNK57747.1 ABC transporter substrate-binding protein [Desulfofustis sp.]